MAKSIAPAKSGRRFGVQPFVELLLEDERSVRWLCRKYGINYSHLTNVGRGRIAPSPELRERLVNYFKLPEEKLFTPEALAAKYIPRKPPCLPLDDGNVK